MNWGWAALFLYIGGFINMVILLQIMKSMSDKSVQSPAMILLIGAFWFVFPVLVLFNVTFGGGGEKRTGD